MSAELKKFQGEFAALQKEAAAVYEEDKKIADAEMKLTGLNNENILGIGRRVRELKAKGATGKDINDFLNDKETNQIYKNVVDVVASLKKNVQEKVAVVASAKQVLNKFDKLKVKLLDEAKARKKKIIGKTSASAPEMEALADEIETFCKTAPGRLADSLVAMSKLNPKPYSDAKVHAKIEAELAKSATKVASDESGDKRRDLEQSLNLRLLKGKLGKMVKLYEQLSTDSMECVTALKSSDPAGAKKLLEKALKTLDEMDAITAPLNEAYEDNKGYLNDPEFSSGAKVIEMLGKFTTLQNKASKTVVTLQKSVK